MKNIFFSMIMFFAVFVISCDSEKSENKTVSESCFSYSPNADINVGDVITFSNCSQDAAYYLWDFGDDSTSVLKEPTHSYTATGTYIVILAAQKREFIDLNGDMVIDGYDGYSDADVIVDTIIVASGN